MVDRPGEPNLAALFDGQTPDQFGAAVEAWGGPLEKLQEMYREWPFFRSVLSNLDMVLAKTDLALASRYAELCSNRTLRREIFGRLSAEWHRARKWLAAITGNAACFTLDSGPSIASRLISSPTSRKNTAIKPSLIQ